MELIIPAFIAGLFTFLAPCTLPLVPAYLGFISGISQEDLLDPLKRTRARWNIFINGLFFILGFTFIFILFGILAGFVGSALAHYQVWLTRVGGIFVMIFGFYVLGVFHVPFLAKERKLKIPFFFQRGNPLNSFLLGTAFSFGWTPCIGPTLGSILALSASSATVKTGALLLFVYSSGLAMPFLLVSLGYGSIIQLTDKMTRFFKPISIMSGVFLVGLGILLLFNHLALLISYGFRLLNFFGLGALEQRLYELL